VEEDERREGGLGGEKNSGQGGDTFGAVCTEASRTRMRSEKGRRRRTAVETGEEHMDGGAGGAVEGRGVGGRGRTGARERGESRGRRGGWRVAVAAAAAAAAAPMEGSESRTRRRRAGHGEG